VADALQSSFAADEDDAEARADVNENDYIDSNDKMPPPPPDAI